MVKAYLGTQLHDFLRLPIPICAESAPVAWLALIRFADALRLVIRVGFTCCYCGVDKESDGSALYCLLACASARQQAQP